MEELNFVQEHSYKYEIKEYEACVNNTIHESNCLTSNSFEQWMTQTDYWIDFIQNGLGSIDYLDHLSNEGNISATCALGKLYYYGLFCQEDKEKGKKYMDKAIARGCSYAAYFVFLEKYKDGIDEENYAEVLEDEYLKMAKKMGCPEAISLIEEDEITGIPGGSRNKNDNSAHMLSLFDLKFSDLPVREELDGVRFATMDLGQEFAAKLSLRHIPYLTLKQIIGFLRRKYEEAGIEASFTKAYLEEGGFRNAIASKFLYGGSFNYAEAINKQSYRAILVSSKNPEYCNQLWVINGTEVNFFFVGGSKAFGEVNQYQTLSNGNFDNVSFFAKMKFFVGVRPDMNRYNQELQWHEEVYNLFCDLNYET